jgi:putative ABC transport system permease protein
MLFIMRLAMTALRSLAAHLTRSLLAMLGVIIGVAAVILAMACVEGAVQDVVQDFESMGPNVLTILPKDERRGHRAIGQSKRLEYEDAVAIAEQCSTVKLAAPQVFAGAQIKCYSNNINTTIAGITPEYAEINNLELQEGSFIEQKDVVGYRRVVVLGSKAAEELCGKGTAIGYFVKVNGQSFRIKGVLKKKGATGTTSVDKQAFVPVTTAQKRLFGINYVTSIEVLLYSPDDVSKAKTQIAQTLRQRHRIAPGSKDIHQVFSREDFLGFLKRVTLIFSALFGAIASISLIVGGIGIMNIMLVSVTERTREIGVRIAVGAQRWHILSQFLTEALMICVLGGCLGLALGYGGSWVLGKMTPIKTAVAPNMVFISLAVAGVVGIFSGLFPAFKASRLDPVESLRYE